MAAVLSPKSASFPHNILHDSPSYGSMDRSSPAKPSLPSISSLIEHIDKQVEAASRRSPDSQYHRKTSSGSYGAPHSPSRHSLAGSPRNQFPPTPPLPGTSSFDFPRHSSGSVSPSANTGRGSYFNISASNGTVENSTTHRSTYPPLPDGGNWSPAPSPSQRRVSDETLSQDSVRTPQGAGVDQMEVTRDCTSLSQQRPLPANFPPPMPSNASYSPIDQQMAIPYQHHHHYPMANAPAFSQNTDRYICSTCQKAFSRPSSLKIHTYSHTGEKPFKCKYDGCGKYFSVRSNMKRHEKGCHGATGGDSSSAGGNSPEPM